MIAAYVRVSTREQVTSGYGVEVQIGHIEKYLSLNNYNLESVKWYKDEGKSASSLERPALKRLIKEIKRNQITHLVVYKLDRIFRNLKDQQSLFELFEKYKVEFKCVTEIIDVNSASGKLNLNVRGSIAEWELDTIRERSLDGMVQSAYEGNYSVPRSPYGYDKVDNKLVINEYESRMVREIFRLASEGLSVWYIMKYLNEGFDQKRKWREQAIYKILRNPIYYGCFAYYGVEIENHSPAIVSKDIFIIANKVGRKGVAKTNVYLFDRKCIHQRCQSAMINTSGKSKNGRIYNYSTCRTCNISVSEVSILAKTEVAIKHYLAEKNKNEEISTIPRLEKQIDDTIQLYVDGLISETAYVRTLMMLEARLKKEIKLRQLVDNGVNILPIHEAERNAILIKDAIESIYINTEEDSVFITFQGDYKYDVDSLLKVTKKY